jgi:hypothetical protein
MDHYFAAVLIFAVGVTGHPFNRLSPSLGSRSSQQGTTSNAPPQTPPNAAKSQDVGATESKLFLREGMPVHMKFLRTVSASHVIAGETVDLQVVEEICLGDVVVIPRDTLVQAIVTLAQTRRSMGQGGRLELKIKAVHLSNGEPAPLRMVKDVNGEGHKIVFPEGLVFIPYVSAILLIPGKDAVVPKGTEVTGYLGRDIAIDLSKFPAAAPTPPPVHGEASQMQEGGPN